MPPGGGGRFAPQILTNTYPQLPHASMQHLANQHQPPGSAGLPPPSYNSHPGFPQTSQNTNTNAFTMNGTNGLAPGFRGGSSLGGGGTGLGSHAAVMAFGYGAAIQQQQQHRETLRRGSGGSKSQSRSRIRDVWKGNLAQEMALLREMIDKYPWVSMDTEFPGIVLRPQGQFHGKADYHYQTLRINVDCLRILQLGITLFNNDGETPPAHPTSQYDSSTFSSPYSQNGMQPCPYTWQFNFQFSVEDDMFNSDSISFLEQSGMNFEQHRTEGIDPATFGALLIPSGLVLFPEVNWISFHSGYDFAYLVKLMMPKPLPDNEADYRKLLDTFFPSIYDIKYMMKMKQRAIMNNTSPPLSPTATNILGTFGTKGGLQDLADELGIKRIGPAHQAGSDALITGKIFWEIKRTIFGGHIDEDKYKGQVWGLNGVGAPASNLGGIGSMLGAAGQAGMDGQSTPNLNGATIYNANGAPSTPGQGNVGLPGHTTPIQAGHEMNNGGGMGNAGIFGRFGMTRG